jgi:DDE superfamily endonuclease
MICDQMNTDRMGEFLAQVSAAHPEEFMVMIVDGASSHVAKALVVPENILLYHLAPSAPQLNPQKHLWDELRGKEFPNRVFENMEGVRKQLNEGLPRLASDNAKIKEICAWPWIMNLNLNANWN